MATTIQKDSVALGTEIQIGSRYLRIGTVTLGADYAAGGVPITAAALGMPAAIDAFIPLGVKGYTCVWDAANSKVLIYVGTTGVEAADNLAGLDGLIMSYVAWGH